MVTPEVAASVNTLFKSTITMLGLLLSNCCNRCIVCVCSGSSIASCSWGVNTHLSAKGSVTPCAENCAAKVSGNRPPLLVPLTQLKHRHQFHNSVLNLLITTKSSEVAERAFPYCCPSKLATKGAATAGKPKDSTKGIKASLAPKVAEIAAVYNYCSIFVLSVLRQLCFA